MINLESNQVYGGSPYTNPPDHPAERPEVHEEYICPRCEGSNNYDQEICESCLIEEEERRGLND